MPKKLTQKRTRTPPPALERALKQELERKAKDKIDDIANVLDVALSRKQTDPEYGRVWNMVPCYPLMGKLELVDPTTLRLTTTNKHDEVSGLPIALYMAEITEKGREMYAEFTRGRYYSERKRTRS